MMSMKKSRKKNMYVSLVLLFAMILSVLSVFPFHVYSATTSGTIADGVYTIGNSALEANYSSYGTFYLRAARLASDSHPTPDVYMSTDTNSDVRYNLLRYWKIEHLGSDVYVIRSMADQNQLLGRTDDGVVTLIRTDGTTFPTETQWKYSTGYWQSVTDATKVLTSRETPRSGATIYSSVLYHYYSPVTVQTAEYMNFDSFTRTAGSVTGICWRNEQTKNLVTSFSSSIQYAMQDNSITYEEFGYSLIVYNASSTANVTWTSNNTSVATVNSATGVVSLKNYGVATITATTSAGSITYTLTVRMLPDGIYYLRNVQVGLYADVEVPEKGLMGNNTPIEQQSFNGDATKKWNIQYYSSNKYTIQSIDNPSLYLGVKNDATANGSAIVLRSGTVTSGMLWTFEKGDEGYKIVNYTASDGTDYVLTVDTSDSTNGVDLVLSDHIAGNQSYRDEWGIISPQHLVMFGIPDVDATDTEGDRVTHDHNGALETAHQAGGWSSSLLYLDSTNVSYWKKLVQTCDVYISRSHGSCTIEDNVVTRTSIRLNDGDSGIYLRSHNSTNALNEDYSNVRMAVFVACHSGEGALNLPQSIVDAGAEVAIGFTDTIDCSDANVWTNTFYLEMLQGKTVEEALLAACTESTILSTNVVICGDGNLTLVK